VVHNRATSHGDKDAVPRLLRCSTYRARALRRAATPAERALWDLVRGQKLGVKFRRQQPLGPYIVDFFCEQAGLVVEVDGAAHFPRPDRDRVRDAVLRAAGCRVLRVPNREVLEHSERVLERLVALFPSPGGLVITQNLERSPSGLPAYGRPARPPHHHRAPVRSWPDNDVPGEERATGAFGRTAWGALATQIVLPMPPIGRHIVLGRALVCGPVAIGRSPAGEHGPDPSTGSSRGPRFSGGPSLGTGLVGHTSGS